MSNSKKNVKTSKQWRIINSRAWQLNDAQIPSFFGSRIYQIMKQSLTKEVKTPQETSFKDTTTINKPAKTHMSQANIKHRREPKSKKQKMKKTATEGLKIAQTTTLEERQKKTRAKQKAKRINN